MPPTFIFIRHGESEHNLAFHAEGSSVFTNEKYKDTPLTEKGKEQARTTAKTLANLKILDIWSSPLTRAIQTAEELFEELDCGKIILHDNLLESLGGGYVCNERKPKHLLKKEYDCWDTSYLSDMPAMWFSPENQYAMYQRLWMILSLIANIYKDEGADKHIVIVSHATILYAITGKKLQNAEYTTMSFSEFKDL